MKISAQTKVKTSLPDAPRVNAIVSPLVVSLGSTATLQVYIDVDPYSNPLETEVLFLNCFVL